MWPLRLDEKFHCSQILAVSVLKIDVSICPPVCLSVYLAICMCICMYNFMHVTCVKRSMETSKVCSISWCWKPNLDPL